MNYNGFIPKNSLIHKMNPSLKFLMVIFVIIMIFIPFGFIYQIVLLGFCLFLFFLAKLPLKKLWRIVRSMFFLAFILILINWVIYKGPGAVFDVDSKAFFAIKQNFFFEPTANAAHIDGKLFIHGDIYGGTIVTQPIPIPNAVVMSGTAIPTPGHIENGFFINQDNFYKLWRIATNNQPGITPNMAVSLLTNISNNLSRELGQTVRFYTSDVDLADGKYTFALFYATNWYTFSSYAITLLFIVVLKIFLMVMIVTILTATTSSVQLTIALEDLLNPLAFLRLPIKEWSITITLGLRFIPSLLEESYRIMNAQSSRGLDFRNGNLKDKVFALISLVVPLFSIGFKKAAELANAMETRGYSPRHLRTRYRNYFIRHFDWLIFVFTLALFGSLITLLTLKGSRTPTLIAYIGVYELIIMF